jgi:NAD dependent epimerase/dehydratase
MSGMFWRGRRVLVTGAGGFIGSHLVESLVAEGAHVRAFVRYNSRGSLGLLHQLPEPVRSQAEMVFGDLRDLVAVEQAMRGVSHVFHLGALIAIPYSYHHPVEVVETNILGTLNVLQAARSTGVERLVHTSSSEVYGTALKVPIGEDHPLQGQSPYSASKIGADKLAESYFRAYGLPVVTLRPFNTYGPRQSTRAVIPAIITQALTGDVVRIGNLEARRDLTYVSDTVQGFVKVAETEGVAGETFNLGTGEEVSIAELAREIFALMGRTPTLEVEPARLRPEESEVHRLLSDNRYASRRLGWSPRVSRREGLLQTIEWIAAHLDLYRSGIYQI